jgi:hypothetical protein
VQRTPQRGLERAARRTEAEAFHPGLAGYPRIMASEMASEAIASGLSKARLCCLEVF